MSRPENKQPFLTGIFSGTILALRGPAAIWCLALAALALLQMAIFPLIAEIPGLAGWLPERAAGLQRLLGVTDPLITPAGFLNAAGIFLLFPLLLSAFAILFGAPLLARKSAAGGLDLMLVRPVSRRRIFLEKFAAVGALLLLMCVLVWLILAWRISALDIPLSLLHLAGALASLLLVALLFTALALTLGAITGRTGLARGLGILLLGITYLLFLSPRFSPPLSGLALLSPFGYALNSNPLGSGVNLTSLAVLLLGVLAWMLVGTLVFERKDL